MHPLVHEARKSEHHTVFGREARRRESMSGEGSEA